MCPAQRIMNMTAGGSHTSTALSRAIARDSSPYTPGAFFLSRQPLRRFFRSIIAAKRAGHAAAPTFIDDTAYRPSSVMAYAMPPSPRGRLSSEGSAHFCDIRPYTPSVTALP